MNQSFFSRYKWIIIASTTILLIIGAYFMLKSYLSVQSLQKHDYYLQDLIDRNYLGSVLIYIAVYVCIIATSLPLIAPLAIAGGFLFGTLAGFLYAEIGTTVGATSAFFVLRAFSTTGALKDQRKRLLKLEEKVKKNGVGYLLMLSLLSIVPFFVINSVAILADVSVFTVAWTTAVGSIPLIFIYALAGSQLRSIGSVKDVFSPQLIVAILLLAVMFFVIPRVIHKIKGLEDA